MEREFGINGAKICIEVVFEGSDGSFSSIGAMGSGRNELKVDVRFLEKVFEDRRTLVVESLQLGF